MPQYQYTSSDENGHRQSGFIAASSEATARDLLAQQAISAESIELVDPDRDDSGNYDTQSERSSSFGMTSDEHVEVVGQVHRQLVVGARVGQQGFNLCFG